MGNRHSLTEWEEHSTAPWAGGGANVAEDALGTVPLEACVGVLGTCERSCPLFLMGWLVSPRDTRPSPKPWYRECDLS